MQNSTTDIAKKINLSDLLDVRERALLAYAEAERLIHEANNTITACVGSPCYNVSNEILRKINYGGFVKAAREPLDEALWLFALKYSSVATTMSTAQKEEFRKQLQTKWCHETRSHVEGPHFTKDNVVSTLLHMQAQSRETFAKMVSDLHCSLSRRHKTNAPMAFGEKFIFEGVRSRWGMNTYWCDLFLDLHRVCALVSNRDAPEAYGGLYAFVQSLTVFGEWAEFEMFRVRIYKNGNVHVHISESLITDRLTEILREQRIE